MIFGLDGLLVREESPELQPNGKTEAADIEPRKVFLRNCLRAIFIVYPSIKYNHFNSTAM
jgi:hypothetical protein